VDTLCSAPSFPWWPSGFSAIAFSALEWYPIAVYATARSASGYGQTMQRDDLRIRFVCLLAMTLPTASASSGRVLPPNADSASATMRMIARR